MKARSRLKSSLAVVATSGSWSFELQGIHPTVSCPATGVGHGSFSEMWGSQGVKWGPQPSCNRLGRSISNPGPVNQPVELEYRNFKLQVTVHDVKNLATAWVGHDRACLMPQSLLTADMTTLSKRSSLLYHRREISSKHIDVSNAALNSQNLTEREPIPGFPHSKHACRR